MRTTFPTFSPTRDHAGLTGRIHNSLLFKRLPLLGSNQDSSDPESCGSGGHVVTTADYGDQRRASGTNGSPLRYPLTHRGPVARGTPPNASRFRTNDRLARRSEDQSRNPAFYPASASTGHAEIRGPDAEKRPRFVPVLDLPKSRGQA